MSTAEHKVEMHRLVMARRAEGKPVWDRKIRLGHVWKNPDMTFEQRREEIVRIIRATSWYRKSPAGDDLRRIISRLARTKTATAWDRAWDEFYDLADSDRVWIDTMSRPVVPSTGETT